MTSAEVSRVRARLEKVLEAFARVHVLVLGDVVLDEYLWGSVERLSPEAPVPVVNVNRESVVLGGAGNVVRNLVALGGRCSFCSVVGDDPDGRQVVELLEKLEVRTDGVIRVEGRPTTRKTRVVANTQQVVRFDRETLRPLCDEDAKKLTSAVERALTDVDIVVMADYGKGLLSSSFVSSCVQRFRDAGVRVAVDPKGQLESYRGVSLLKPNLREAEVLSGLPVKSIEDACRAIARIQEVVGGVDVVLTRGNQGMMVFEGGSDGIDVPTSSREVFDVQGAGDTAMATLALAQSAGATLQEAAILANASAGVVVEKIGTATVTRDEIRAVLPVAIDASGVES